MIDAFGNEIKIGDNVVYPFASSVADMYYAIGKVVKVNQKSIQVTYKTAVRKDKKTRRVSGNSLVIKLNADQLGYIEQQLMFNELSK